VLNNSVPPENGFNDRQLAASLLVLDGAAPAPEQHIVFRSTTRGDVEVAGYELPGEPAGADQAALRRWLLRNDLAGEALLGISVLVIREVLDAADSIRECVLEYRRGSATGPFYGNPARIEFAGPARQVRHYRTLRNGRLAETAPIPAVPTPAIPTSATGLSTTPASATPAPRALDPITSRLPQPDDPVTVSVEFGALRARFGAGLILLDCRRPTMFEDMVGLTKIAHLRLPDGQEVGCGIGWHGGMPFVLTADFPRFSAGFELTESQEASVVSMLAVHDLLRYELRLDSHGICVVARQRGGSDLFILRPGINAASVEPFQPNRRRYGAVDQRRWIRYCETYEQHRVLDVYPAHASNELVVVTADGDGQAWCHHIDSDGVEVSRAPHNDAAVAALFRERVARERVSMQQAAAERAVAPPSDAPRAAPPVDSLLAMVQVVSDALSALRDARFACAEASDQHVAVPANALLALRALRTAQRRLGVGGSASAAQALLRRVDRKTVDVAAFDRTLLVIERRLMDELATIHVAPLHPSGRRRMARRRVGHAEPDAGSRGPS
jgi:hypothetical protein